MGFYNGCVVRFPCMPGEGRGQEAVNDGVDQ